MAQSSVDSDRLSSAGISTHSSVTAGPVGGSVVGVRVGDPGLKREDEDEYNLGPLPPMWEKAFTPSGEVYFIDHNTGTSHWLDPRLARVRKRSLGECGEDELPFGWERVTDERYGSYYVDHINRRTQYENPVLQARRLRAEKIGTENGGTTTPNGQPPTGELRGERFTLPLTKGTQGLGFTLIGAEGVPEMEGYLQIRSIVPHSPAWIDGALRPGDVLVGVGQRGVRGLTHAQVAQIFQSIAAGETVALHVVRGYPLSFDSADPNTRVLSTLAVDATATAMQHLTTALRARFNLDSPNAQEVTSRDETDNSPMGHRNEPTQRCASADHLLSCNEHTTENITANEPGREFVVTLRRGAAGFGFTIADSVHGQKVKKVLDRSRCAGLREGDLLLQIGEVDVRHAPHQRVVQVLKDCPALHETTLRVWRRNNPSLRAPRSRSATRIPTTTPVNPNVSRSKTPTAEQLRSPLANTQENVNDRLNGMNSVEATYAVPEHKRERESLIDRRRRSSTPGGRLTLPAQQWDGWTHGGPEWPANSPQWPDQTQHWNGDRWGNENWSEVPTPTVHVDMNAAYWTGNASVADTSDNGFPEDGMLHSPTTATIGGLCNQSNRLRPHSPSNSTDRLRSNSPSNTSATDRLLANSPSTRQSQSPSAQSSDRVKSPNRMRDPSPPRHRSPSCYDDNLHNAGYGVNYPQVEAGGISDPMADVIVGIGRGGSGFGFRIVGGHEDGSRVAVGYVLPGGPADGLLRPGDLLTSVDGISLIGATHAKAVHCVCRAAARGHVTLGVRHNRADVQPIGIPTMVSPIQHQQPEPALHHMMPQGSYNIVHPAPMYPPAANTMYNPQYDNGWGPDAYEVTLTRNDGEGFGFVVISSTNKATSTIGQLIPNSPAARCGLLHVGDTILGINHVAIRNMAHPEVVALIKHSGERLVLTVRSAQRE